MAWALQRAFLQTLPHAAPVSARLSHLPTNADESKDECRIPAVTVFAPAGCGWPAPQVRSSHGTKSTKPNLDVQPKSLVNVLLPGIAWTVASCRLEEACGHAFCRRSTRPVVWLGQHKSLISTNNDLFPKDIEALRLVAYARRLQAP